VAEAFLHCMIAIEIPIQESEETSKAVSTRLSLLTHRKFDRSAPAQVAFIKGLYSRRSKYVHEGKIDPSLGHADESQAELERRSFDESLELASELLMCLLRLHKGNVWPEEGRKKWFSRMDFIWAAIKDDQTPEDQFYLEIGAEVP
jgi:hypothetical protein